MRAPAAEPHWRPPTSAAQPCGARRFLLAPATLSALRSHLCTRRLVRSQTPIRTRFASPMQPYVCTRRLLLGLALPALRSHMCIRRLPPSLAPPWQLKRSHACTRKLPLASARQLRAAMCPPTGSRSHPPARCTHVATCVSTCRSHSHLCQRCSAPMRRHPGRISLAPSCQLCASTCVLVRCPTLATLHRLCAALWHQQTPTRTRFASPAQPRVHSQAPNRNPLFPGVRSHTCTLQLQLAPPC